MKIAECAFNSNITVYQIDDTNGACLLIEDFLENIRHQVIEIIEFELESMKNVKLQMRLFANYENPIAMLNAEGELDGENYVKLADFQPSFEIVTRCSNVM